MVAAPYDTLSFLYIIAMFHEAPGKLHLHGSLCRMGDMVVQLLEVRWYLQRKSNLLWPDDQVEYPFYEAIREEFQEA